MKDRIFRRGKVKFKYLYPLIGEPKGIEVYNQSHSMIYTNRGTPSLFTEIANLGVTSIMLTPNLVLVYVYTDKRWSKRFAKTCQRIYGEVPKRLLKSFEKPRIIPLKEKKLKPKKTRIYIPKHMAKTNEGRKSNATKTKR